MLTGGKLKTLVKHLLPITRIRYKSHPYISLIVLLTRGLDWEFNYFGAQDKTRPHVM